MAQARATAFEGAGHAVGLGLVVGAAEAAWLTLGRPTGAPLPERLALGLVDAGLLGALAGLVALLVAPLVLRADAPHRAAALQVATAALALGALLAWPTAAVELGGNRAVAGLLFAALPLLVGAAVYGQARFWLARAAAGTAPPVGWLPVAGSVAALGVALPAVLGGAGGGPTGDAPSVLLVTVDGLRPSDVGATGGAATPRLDALAAAGTAFGTAVAPSPSSVASHATMLTGLEPLRHRAIDDLRPLAAGMPTVARRLSATHATAAFVSSAVVSGVGLDQGFAVFDDAFGPFGVGRLALVDLVAGSRLVRRGADLTVERAVGWLAAARGPAFVWVHLERPADADVAPLDAAVGRLVDALGERRAVVIVAGATADRPGASGSGLGDDRVRVPVVLRAPEVGPIPRVDVQVRLVDVAATALVGAGVERPDEVEGVDLVAFLAGRRSQGATSVLVDAGGGRRQLGLRQDGVKVVIEPASGAGEVFDLSTDPGEAQDLAASQQATLASALAALRPDVEALAAAEAGPVLGGGRRARLVALGWRP